MATLTIEGLGTLTVDSNGHVDCEGMGPARREAIAQRVSIVRHRCVNADNSVHSYFRACIDGHDCSGRTVEQLCRAYADRAESVDYVDDPHRMAQYASIVLAGDKGIPNHIERNDYQGFDVVTDEGRRFRFCQK